MSWLSINLNDSLNSLKGQISTLTREVLSEEIEDESGDEQIVVPRDQIKALEAQINLQKHELEESRKTQMELEERLHAGDLHASHQLGILKKQLEEQEKELRNYKARFSEWGWDEGGGEEITQAVTRNSLEKPSSEAANAQELSARVQDLEGELAALRDRHQREVATLLDQQEALRERVREGEIGEEKTRLEHKKQDGGHEWETEQNERGRGENERREEEREREKREEERKREMKKLEEECRTLKEENEQHARNIEELDKQHQDAIDRILQKRKEIQKELIKEREERSQLEMQLAGIEKEREKEKIEKEEKEEKKEKKEIEKEKKEIEKEKEQEKEKTEKEALKKELEGEREKRMSVEEKQEEMRKILEKKEEEEKELKKKLAKEEEEKEMMRTKLAKGEEEKAAIIAKLAKEEEEKAAIVAKLAKEEEEKAAIIAKLAKEEEEKEAIREKLAKEEREKEAINAKLTKEEQEKEAIRTKLSEKEREMEEWQRNGTKEGKEPKPDSSLALERELEEKAALLESRCSLLESELQAKAQELSMSAHECESLRKRAKEELEEVRKALGSHVRENPDTISKGVHRLADLLRDSSWQRDTLERHVSGVTQELREKRRMLEEAESARAELERECEDLRDQLEEVQKGERPTPEGGPRAGGGGLPTIEEEEDAEGEGEGAEREVKEARRSPTGLGGEDEEEGEVAKMATEEGGKDGKVRKRDGRDAKKEQAEDEEESSRLSRIHYLEAQVEALSEARRNLEIEVVRLRAEQGDALARLRDREEGRAGNILNLETEAASLRQVKVVLEEEVGTLKAEGHRRKEEKERLEEEVRALRQEGHAIREEKERLMGQLDTLTRQLDLEAVTHKDEREGLEEKQHALEEKIRTLEDELGHLRASEGLNAHERQSLGQQLLLQYRAVEERNELISRLEGELHDMTLKQAVLQAPERTLEDLRMQLEEREKELNAAKSQIIFKDDKVDELNQSLSELRGKITELTKSLSERDEKLRELSKEIQKRDEKVSELTQNLSENNDKVNEMTLEKMTEVSALKEQVEREREEIERKREEVERKEEELERKNGEMEQKKEEIERDREELKINKEELERNRDQLDHSETELFQLREKMEELINENKRREEEQKEKREEEEKKKTEERETWNKEKEALERVKENLVQEIEKAKLRESEREKQDDSTIKQRREEEEREEEERNRMKQQIECFRGEREEMIKALKQKHEESLAYHAEVQRLSAVLMQMNEHTKEFERAKKEEEEKMKTELEKTKKEEERVKVELEKARREEEKARREEERAKREQGEWEKGQKAITEERDQLRLANAQFNNQYQEQSKELAQLRERETRLASECERLRQHLINVEEAYTQEIVKGEERETTLKKALSKMEERMATVAASQRSSSHTEALLEQLREMTSQRDDAVLRLHDAEETAQQSQQSLGTLQKVLEDFQRRQSREILDATDRQARALQEEKERALGLEEEIRALKMQLQEAQNGLDAASRLGEQLNRKESVIASLRAQVSSQEEVVRRAQGEMMALKSSSDNKVDKPLLRNLMVGYFATPPDKRPEVLRILAEVLDFSSEERARTGLLSHEGGGSWLTSLAHFLAPPASNVRVTSRVDVLDHTSLSQAFIRFLEDESNPRPRPPRLPAVEMAEDTERKKKRKDKRENEMILPIAALSAEQNATTDQQRANLNSSPLLAAASTSSAPSPSSPATGGLPTITTPLAGTSPPNPQGEEASKGLLNPVEIQAHKGSSLPVTSPSGASNRFLSNLLKDSHEADVNHNN